MLHTKIIVYIKLLMQNKKKLKNLKKHRYTQHCNIQLSIFIKF